MLSEAAAQSAAASAAAIAEPRLTYRPHLDGLRALAVYLVVAFHARLGLFSGGFIGVDVFFVLSGFLVTRLLLRDLVAFNGVRLEVFYSRRVRRILPAAIITLTVTALVYAAVATPVELLDALGGFRAAFLYIANWFFIHQANDYFAPNVDTSPILHFWSLAVEEQFYLLWPLLLSVLYVATERAGRRRWWVMRALVVAVGVLSVVRALRLAHGGQLDRAYYGTDTRAYQLLAGAFLALTPQLLRLPGVVRRRASRAAAVSLALVVLLATSIVKFGPITRGVYAAVLVFVLIAALDNARGGIARGALSRPSLTYLGRISYGTYLWHWPLVVLITRDHDVAPVALFLIVCPLATLLAALSFKIIEHPVRVARSLDRHKARVIAVGLIASVVGGLVLMPWILDPKSTSVADAEVTSSKFHQLDWRVALKDSPYAPDCVGRSFVNCVLVRGTGSRVLLIGDSNAEMWLPAAEQIAKDQGWTLGLSSLGSCPWQRGVMFTFAAADGPYCTQHQTDWYQRELPEFDPDIVIFGERAYDDPRDNSAVRFANGDVLNYGDPGFESRLVDASDATIAAVRKPGRKIVVLEPIPPPWRFESINCLSAGKRPQDCGYDASATPTPLELGLRAAARAPDVWSIDLDRVVCPRLPACDAVINDVIVSRRDGHVTASFASSVADQIEAIFRRNGITSR